MLIRHDTSAYNVLKDKKKNNPVYREFLKEWDKNPDSLICQALAAEIKSEWALGVGDSDTPLADAEGKQAFATGKALRTAHAEVPDVIYVSPYNRALATLKHITRGWPELGDVRVYEEERIREQEHGVSLLYNDWRVFHTLHPEQRALHKIEGPYWYRYPQGESVPDVRERNRSWISTLVREYSGKKVLAVTHHLNILAQRANFERFGAERFIHLDEKERPINCGVTLYTGYPSEGSNGRLKLTYYNKKLY